MKICRIFLCGFLLFAMALAASNAAADQSDKRLPHLFQQMKNAHNAAESAQAQSRIWSVWLETSDANAQKALERGVLAMNENNYGEALHQFNLLIKRAPKFAEGWNKRATLYYLMGRLDESLADIDQTLELEPRHFGALSGLAMIQATKGNEKAAIDAFERVLHLVPQDQSAKENLEFLKKRLADKAI